MRTYKTVTIDDIAGLWEQNCVYLGIDGNSGTAYYQLRSYNITSIDGVNGTYVDTEGLYTKSGCAGNPVAYYTYPATIEIDSTIGNGTGVAMVDLVNVNGLHTIITNGVSFLTPSSVTAEISSWLRSHNPPTKILEIMISDTSSNYLFVDGRMEKWVVDKFEPYTREENAINDVYVRKTLAEPLPNL